MDEQQKVAQILELSHSPNCSPGVIEFVSREVIGDMALFSKTESLNETSVS
jgi:hypothetical protein